MQSDYTVRDRFRNTLLCASIFWQSNDFSMAWSGRTTVFGRERIFHDINVF